jgi:hypothetical protein
LKNKSFELLDSQQRGSNDLQEAKALALTLQIRKNDSKLNKFLSDTWASHQQFEEAMNQLKAYVKTQMALQKGPHIHQLIQISETLEDSSNELTRSVTKAIQEVDDTKIRIL